MRCDLHTHTNYSDGDLDINGNVLKAYELGFDGIAITDHDNIDSWEEIDFNHYPILVFKGVEISAQYKGDIVHVLGYYKNKGDYSELSTFLEKVRKERIERVELIIKKLEEFGIKITTSDVLGEADGAVTRPHIVNAIIKKYPERGYTTNYLFKHYLGNDCPCFVPVNEVQVNEVIDLLKRNNCLVVLAHPLLLSKNDYLDLISLGFDGVECFYKYNFRTKRDVYREVKDLGLIITGGSDYHGPIARDNMGLAYLAGDEVKLFLESINWEVEDE